MENYSICGIAKVDGGFKNIILNSDSSFSDKNVKEVVYSTAFDDVESLFGFSDLNIIELECDSSIVANSKEFLANNDYADGIIFLNKGFLIITDLVFFSAFTRIDGKDTPYTSVVESDTYEDDVALQMIEEDIRLQ